jgi:thioredoxin 1
MKVVLTITAAMLLAVAGCGGAKSAQPAAKADTGAAKTEMTSLPKLWDFWATWCPPCKELKPTIEALATEYAGKIEIKSIDIDQNKEMSDKYGIQAVPTLVFLDKDGKELSRIVGAVPKDTIVGRFKSLGFIQ